MSTTTLLQATQLISLSTSLFLSGINFGASHLIVPILHRLDAKSVSPTALASLYQRGTRLVIPLAVLSTLTSAFLAIRSSGQYRVQWIIAAVTTFASLPFTKVVMMETNRALLRFAGDEANLDERQGLKTDIEQEQDKAEVARLLRRWKRMNLIRSAFALVGGLTAAVTVVFGRR